MTAVRWVFAWAPLAVITVALWEHDSPVAAACVVVAALAARKHLLLSAAAAAFFIWLGHVGYAIAVGGAVYGLVWVGIVGRSFQVISKRPARPASVVPRIRCRHGFQKRIRAADEVLRQGLGAAALDAYLKILADHQVGRCDRALYLRSAEAAVLAGNARLAIELADAAARDVRGEPVGQLATIIARADGIRARAYLLLDDVTSAAKAIRKAQARTQAGRSTDRYLRWAAADVRLAEWTVKSADDASDGLASALRQQRLTMHPSEPLGRCMLSAGWRALDAGYAKPAFELAVAAADMAKLGGPLVQAIAESEKAKTAPRRRATAWSLYRDAVLLQVAAAASVSGGDNAPSDKVVGRAVSVATRLDDPWAAARLMFEDARWSVRNEKTGSAAGLLRQALSLGDYRLHTFSDADRQAAWVAIRSSMSALLEEITGEPGSGLVEARPSAPAQRQRQQAAAQESLRLFTRLRQRAPDVFAAAHARVLASTGHPPPDAVPAAVPASGQAQAAPTALPAVAPGATPAARENRPKAAPARSKADPGPVWLRDLLASGPGERCWTVYQAFLLAQSMRHGEVTPEHLLPVLLADRPISRVAAELDAPLADLYAAVSARFGAVGGTPGPDARLEPLLNAAAAEAVRWSERRVRPAWLMLAVLRESASAGSALLESYGVDRCEFLVRLLAVSVTWSPPARSPLFAIETIVGPGHLTTSARLALAGATDIAMAESGLMGVHHLQAAVQRYDWSARSPQIAVPSTRGNEVKVTGSARTALRTALHLASSRGALGIGLEQLRRAITADAGPQKEFSSAAKSAIQSAHWHAAAQRRAYVQPADLRRSVEGSSGQEHPRPYNGVPPVLTPQTEQLIAAAERAAFGCVQVDDLRTVLEERRAAR